MRHYNVARLRRGHGVFIDGPALRVDLAAVGPDDRIENDAAMLAACHPDSFFFVSGGGTVLIGGRHLLVVRRGERALFNPGHLSLFTGRADGPEELENPRRLARELFEELVMFADGRMLSPRCPAFQSIIDAVLVRAGRADGVPLPLRQMPLQPGRLTICRGPRTLLDGPSFWHANARNDINVLFLFEADLELSRVVAEDGEPSEHGGGRIVAALDLETMTLVDLTVPPQRRAPIDARALPMTEHLAAMIDAMAYAASTATAARKATR